MSERPGNLIAIALEIAVVLAVYAQTLGYVAGD
jgi:hypothetical protein